MLTDTNVRDFKMVRLNHAGDSLENPILTGLNFEIRYHHAPGETLKKCWVQVASAVFFDLTALVVSLDTKTWRVPVLSGTHLSAGTPPVFNKIILTSSNGFSVAGAYVTSIPPHQVLIDGYDGQNEDEPLLLHIYDARYTNDPAAPSDYDYPYD